MAEDEFDCKKGGMGVLMEGFEGLVGSFIKPYLKAFDVATGLPDSIVPPAMTPGELIKLLGTLAPPAGLGIGALEMKGKIDALPVMPLPKPLVPMGGMDAPPLTGLALAGLVKGMAVDMLPGMVAGAAGVKLDGLNVAGIVAPVPPTFPGAIKDAMGKIPGLQPGAVDQMTKCIQEVMESALSPMTGGGDAAGEGEGGEGSEEA